MNYAEIARDARKTVLRMIHYAQTAHVGSNMSCIDLATVLYEHINLQEDKVIWSKGWAAATAYYFIASKGFIPRDDLLKFPSPPYLGLLERGVPGIEASTGSAGHGLPIGVGMALAKKLQEEAGKIYVIMGDGELNCGTTWESLLIASQHKLNNLFVIIDMNSLQAMGDTRSILDIEPLRFKFSDFGWNCFETNGHDYELLENSFNADFGDELPVCLIARTIKGKGISFMENKTEWHYKNITDEDYKNALEELYETE